MKSPNLLITTTFALASLFSGCGGGGGGSAAAPAASPAALTSGNMTAAAQVAVAAAFLPIESSQELTGVQTITESKLFSFARAQMGKLPAYMANAAANSSSTGVVASLTVNCTISGSMTVTVNDMDSDGVPSAGDSVSITFNNCVESDGTLSGSIIFVINAISGTSDTYPYSEDVTVTYGNYTLTNAQSSASINGSMKLSVSRTDQYAFTASVSTPSLTVSASYGGVTRSLTISDYSATTTRTPDPTYVYLTSHTITGSVTSSALNSQTISFTTPTGFVDRGTDVYPSTGVMAVTGASNSKLRITAISNTEVTEELDADGDGIYEVGPTTVNWNTLY